MKRFFLFFVGVVFAVLGGQHMAFAAPQKGQEAALDISAQESLEWYEAKGLYVARGKAQAIHGTTLVEADLLTAHRRAITEGKKAVEKDAGPNVGAGDLDRLTAEGNVHIKDNNQEIFGDMATYDMDKKIFKVTGHNLKYITGQDVVTARDSLEYYQDKGVAVARGRAVALHAGSRIEADVLSALFGQDKAGQREMKKMMAKGGVIIVTKDGNVSRGDRAIYNVAKETAVLLDHVRLTQGETQMSGDKAEINFKTGRSRLLNDGSGRVRALLPTSSAAKKKETTP